jgi:hypothetical protein
MQLARQTSRILFLALVVTVGAPACGVAPAVAATAGQATDNGAIRIAGAIVKRYAGWIISLAWEIYDHVSGGSVPPPSMPPEEEPPVHDPDYTP